MSSHSRPFLAILQLKIVVRIKHCFCLQYCQVAFDNTNPGFFGDCSFVVFGRVFAFEEKSKIEKERSKIDNGLTLRAEFITLCTSVGVCNLLRFEASSMETKSRSEAEKLCPDIKNL